MMLRRGGVPLSLVGGGRGAGQVGVGWLVPAHKFGDAHK